MNGALVVSDTSPLHYLILIEAIDLLPKLVSGVLIPPAVAKELSNSNTPLEVRRWIGDPPPWLQIAAPRTIDNSLGLDRGETEAISLAIEREIRAVLIDERKGFAVAKSRGLEPLGLLAILEVSAMRGLIIFDEAVERLKATTFHCSENLFTEIRRRLRGR